MVTLDPVRELQKLATSRYANHSTTDMDSGSGEHREDGCSIYFGPSPEVDTLRLSIAANFDRDTDAFVGYTWSWYACRTPSPDDPDGDPWELAVTDGATHLAYVWMQIRDYLHYSPGRPPARHTPS